VTHPLAEELVPQVQVGVEHQHQVGLQAPQRAEGDCVLAAQHHREAVERVHRLRHAFEGLGYVGALHVAYVGESQVAPVEPGADAVGV
jgi:hypothetical protein